MADAKDSANFDPRYDPAFQPGYTSRRGRSDGEDNNAVPAGMDVEPVVVDVESVEIDDEPAGNEVMPVGLSDPNPFERSLWVVAVVLVVGGLAASIWANSVNFASSSTGWGWPLMIQASAWALVTPMITVGLGTGVGLLFRRAITWNPDQ